MIVSNICRNLTKLRLNICLNSSLRQSNVYKTKTSFSTCKIFQAKQNPNVDRRAHATRTATFYVASGIVFMIGASYAAVPLYKMFCESQGLDSSTNFKDYTDEQLKDRLKKLKKVENRTIKVKFQATTSTDILWKFQPQQDEISLAIGETALAFYKARNLTDKPVVGIATYTIIPFEAGLYFNKIQCFCFEEQRLEPNEEVDMPVFFFIDDSFNEDPSLEKVDTIFLSYTFFESKDSIDLQHHIPKLPRALLK